MLTQNIIAQHLDLSQAEVSKLMKELGVDWRKADLAVIRTAYIRKLRAVAAGHQSADGYDLTKERALSERVSRELNELALAEKKGQMVNVATVEAELTQMVVAFRTELISRDDRLKTDLDALYGIDIDMQVLNDLTHDCLTQLSRYDPSGASPDASARVEDGAAGTDDDDGMGTPA